MRQPIIAGNWKMFKTLAETSAFFNALLPAVQHVEHCDIVVAPPFTALSTAIGYTEGTRIGISAQDAHWEKEGAFTGEVSAKMLRDVGCTYTIIGHSERRQVRNGLGRLTEANLSHIIVAYEPVWAIGTGRTATPEIAAEMHAAIRKTFAEIYNEAAADALRILYGGSVKPDNIAALMKKEDIDGALVGGASLDSASFARIIKY